MDFATCSVGHLCGALLFLDKQKALAGMSLDSIIMRDLVKAILVKKALTPRQLAVLRMKLPLYAGRLVNHQITPYALDVADGVSKDYRIGLHNPRTLRVYMPPQSPMKNIIAKMGYEAHPDFFCVPATKRNVHVLQHNGFVSDARVHERVMQKEEKMLIDFSLHSDIQAKPYQLEGIAFMRARQGRILLADDVGLGKTMQTIMWALTSQIQKICVVCPASLKGNWRKEIGKWSGDMSDVCILTGKKADVSFLSSLQNYRWVIINYDIVAAWKPLLEKAKFDCFVFDEAQALKNKTAARTKASLQIAKKSKHIIALSATPIENKPIEFWPLLQLIDSVLFPSKAYFENKFCGVRQIQKKIQGKDVSITVKDGASNIKELHQILKDTIMLRRKKEDVLKELPEKQRAVIPISLPRQMQSQYNRIERDFVSWMEDQGVVMTKKQKQAEALVKLGYLKQFVAKAKLALIFDWIDTYLENENKLVVFAYHKEIIEALKNRYVDNSVVIDGSTPTDKRQGLVDSFQEDPKINLFIGNIRAAGAGLTLTAAKDTLTIEFAWTSTAHDQAEGRTHRIGQKNAVTAYYIIAENTIEQRIATILDEKRKIISGIMDGEEVEQAALLNELLKDYQNAKTP